MDKVIQDWADEGQKELREWHDQVKMAVAGDDEALKAHVAWQIPSLKNETIKNI